MNPRSLDIGNDPRGGGATPDFCSDSNCPFKAAASICYMDNKPFMINTRRVRIGQMLYIAGEEIGQLSEVKPDSILVKDRNNVTCCYRIGDSDFSRITTIPAE